MAHPPIPPLPPDIDYLPPQPSDGMSPGAKWGIGCSLGCLLLALVVGGLGIFGVIKAKQWGTAMLDQYTADAPLAFEAPVASPETVAALLERFDAFSAAMREGAEAEPLVLSGDEINLLIHHHPDWQELAGHVSVAIEDDQLTGTLSIPLDPIGGFLAGRFLNGKATLRLALSGESLEAYIEEIEVANQTLPETITRELKGKNLFEDAATDPEFRVTMGALDELRVAEGRLFIVPKPPERRPRRDPPESPDPAVEPPD